MAALTMKELLEAGVHFGHQTKRWNPKMQKYIFGERNGIYIIDLQKTLKKALVGIKNLDRLPSAVFIIDPKKEDIVVEEARRLAIPIVAIVDTNCDPTVIDYPIPGNDDAIRAVRLITARMADAINEGRGTLAKEEAEDIPASPDMPVVTEAEMTASAEAGA